MASSSARSFAHVGEHEVQLLRAWMAEGKHIKTMANLLQRDETTIRRQLKRMRVKSPRRRVGRPCKLSPKMEAKVVRTAERMIQQAESEWQVTADMIRKALKLKCCLRVVSNALHRHNVYLRPMRQKPILTKIDAEQRFAFSEAYRHKPVSFWTDKVHGYMDNKIFPTYLNAKARAYARKLRPRGTYRAPGQGLDRGHVKPRKDLKQNFGPSVNVSVAISATKVLMCHVVKGPWNKESATDMYENALGPALRTEHPGRRRFLVLEDNDPTGYKCQMAKDAKKALGVSVLEIPKRSPDLNPLDYSFWSEVNACLRRQEAKFQEDYRESRCQFIKRLRRTVLRISPDTLRGMVGNMKRRCELLHQVGGQHFEEGS